jgi:hypothetical protein
MFKHPKCGGTHETVAQARACEQGGGVVTQDRPTSQPDKHTQAQSVVLERLRSQAHYTVSINAPRRGRIANPATEPMVKFLTDLIGKRDWRELQEQGWKVREMGERLAQGATPDFQEAREMITALKPLGNREDSRPVSPAPQGTSRVNYAEMRKLKGQVPDGRYAVDLPGGDKVKFFAVRTRRDSQYFTVTHHVSDNRYPWPVSRYAEVLREIILATPQAAGQRYAEEYGACYNCGRALTDTDNPYKPYGLGPDCGPKVRG